jgi:hypothetical protein
MFRQMAEAGVEVTAEPDLLGGFLKDSDPLKPAVAEVGLGSRTE